jgi:hypothetical protein
VDEENWLTSQQVAARLGISTADVRRRSRSLGGIKGPNGRWRFPESRLTASQPDIGVRRTVLVAALCLAVGLLIGHGLWGGQQTNAVPIPRATVTVTAAPLSDATLRGGASDDLGSGALPTIGNSAHARCRDGTLSYSVNRQGTCSWHGGVAEWLR